jgi:hypothetical protein
MLFIIISSLSSSSLFLYTNSSYQSIFSEVNTSSNSQHFLSCKPLQFKAIKITLILEWMRKTLATGVVGGGGGVGCRVGVIIAVTRLRPGRCPGWLWGPHSLLVSGYLGSFPVVKQPGRKTDHSTLFIAEVKKGWRHTSAPPIYLLGMERYSLTFCLHVAQEFTHLHRLVARASEFGSCWRNFFSIIIVIFPLT